MTRNGHLRRRDIDVGCDCRTISSRGRDMHASFFRAYLGDMNIYGGGELQIRKPPAGQPDLIGSVTVVRASYDFQGRRFEVLRDSQIRFQGTRPDRSALQVNAQRIISGVTAIVNIAVRRVQRK